MVNLATVLTGIAVLAVIVIAMYVIIRDRKRGLNSCGCKCSDCAGCSPIDPIMPMDGDNTSDASDDDRSE